MSSHWNFNSSYINMVAMETDVTFGSVIHSYSADTERRYQTEHRQILSKTLIFNFKNI